MLPGDSPEQALDTGSLVAAELLVLAVNVVYHLADRAQRGVAQPKPPEQRLEGAAVPFVRVLGLEHVEAQLAPARRVTLGSHEFEPGRLIDEALDQPRARDAIHEHAPARDPRPPAHSPRSTGGTSPANSPSFPGLAE